MHRHPLLAVAPSRARSGWFKSAHSRGALCVSANNYLVNLYTLLRDLHWANSVMTGKVPPSSTYLSNKRKLIRPELALQGGKKSLPAPSMSSAQLSQWPWCSLRWCSSHRTEMKPKSQPFNLLSKWQVVPILVSFRSEVNWPCLPFISPTVNPTVGSRAAYGQLRVTSTRLGQALHTAKLCGFGICISVAQCLSCDHSPL